MRTITITVPYIVFSSKPVTTKAGTNIAHLFHEIFPLAAVGSFFLSEVIIQKCFGKPFPAFWSLDFMFSGTSSGENISLYKLPFPPAVLLSRLFRCQFLVICGSLTGSSGCRLTDSNETFHGCHLHYQCRSISSEPLSTKLWKTQLLPVGVFILSTTSGRCSASPWELEHIRIS